MPVKNFKQLSTEISYHGAVMVQRESGGPQLGPAIMIPRDASLPDNYTSDRFCFSSLGMPTLHFLPGIYKPT